MTRRTTPALKLDQSEAVMMAPPEPKPATPTPDGQPIPDTENPAIPSLPESPPAPMTDPSPDGPVPLPEVGGPAGPEPTRFGDWDLNGKCVDF